MLARLRKIIRSEFIQNTGKQAAVFGIIGVFTIIIDLTIYLGLLWIGTQTWMAKAIAFIFGTLFAYFANKTFNFETGSGTIKEFGKILLLYLVGMVINVSLNSIVISILDSTTLGYIIATTSSALFNFIGMKMIFARSTINFRRDS